MIPKGERVIMKKVCMILLAISVLLCFAACGKTKTVHCDHCQKEVSIAEDSNMTEEWTIFCKECEQELFGNNPVVTPTP